MQVGSVHSDKSDLICAMSNLRELTMDSICMNDRNSCFSGCLPVSISNLKTMQMLSLSGNRLEGTLPSELFECANLVGLSLLSNRLSGDLHRLPFEKLPLLRKLNLAQNRFSGRFPSGIGACTLLEVLLLSSNEGLSGALPPSMSSLRRLRAVSLGGTAIENAAPSLAEYLPNCQLVSEPEGLRMCILAMSMARPS